MHIITISKGVMFTCKEGITPMGRTLTDDRKQLRRDAIKLRQDLGWSERRIGEELGVSNDTIHNWLQINKQFTHVIIKQSRHVLDNSTSKVLHNPPLALNRVHVMDCVTGLNRLPHPACTIAELADILLLTTSANKSGRSLFSLSSEYALELPCAEFLIITLSLSI